MKLLLKNGADVKVKDKNGLSILQIAKSLGNENIINMLKEAGAKE